LGTYVGYRAGQLFSDNDGFRYANTYIGSQAGYNNHTSSQYNTIVGHKAGHNSTNIGDGNTIIGAFMYEGEGALTDGSFENTVVIGSYNQARLQVSSSGKFQFHDYGSGTFDEATESTTLTKQLGVDANGHVIETGVTYMGSTSVSFTSGAGTFTLSPIPTHIVLTLQTTTLGEILTYNSVSGAGVVTVNLRTYGGGLVTGTRTVHYMYKV